MSNSKNNGRTMAMVKADIEKKVSEWNLATAEEKRNTIEIAAKAFVDEYNELAVLTAYSEFKAAENPMLEFAKAYSYKTCSVSVRPHSEVVNSVKKSVSTMTADFEKNRLLNVTKFVNWMAEAGVNVAKDPEWITKIGAARDELVKQWKSFIETEGRFVVSDLKRSLQAMVDALMVVEGEKGGNALIVTGKTARAAIAFCNTRKDGLVGNVCPRSVWERVQMDVFHAAATKKEYTITYGDPEPETEEEETTEGENNPN